MARECLDKCVYLAQLSDAFKDDLAKLMMPFDAPEGHVFISEGDPINSFLVVERGTLIRTKKVASVGRRNSTPDDPPLEIDTIGPYTHSGLLHVAGQPNEEVAFATIAAGKGGATVYVVPGGHFRKLCNENPAYSAEMIEQLTHALRSSTKILRATLAKNPGEHHEEKSAKKTTMKVLCYDTTAWVKENFEPMVQSFNEKDKELTIEMDYTQDRLGMSTAKYAAGYDAVCLFVNDTANSDTLWSLSMGGVKLILMRCAGFDRVNVKVAHSFGLEIARVPAYSPYAVAEHAIALLMSVNRRITQANAKVKMADFTLDSSLLGVDIHGKNVGVMGTGKIGQILCRIITGFGANLLAYDVFEADAVKEMGGKYVSQDEIYKECDVIFLMMPLLPATKHTINAEVIPKLKKGVILINTSRGGLIDTSALVTGLQTGVIGGCGLDVYENEEAYFFQDWSGEAIEDQTLVTLLGSNRVVMTAHQAFFTKEAVSKIVSTTIENASNFSSGLRGKELPNSVN